MADNQQFSQSSVDSAQAVLSDLKAKAKTAQEAGDLHTFSILTELIGVCSPIVTRAFARQMREERSRINKAHKELRANNRPHPTRE
jgi:hypothetical protein